MVVFSLPLSPYPHPHLPTTFKISFIFFFVLVLKDRYLHLHTTLALAHAPRTFPFSNGLLVGNHSEKKKKNQPGFPAIFLPVCNHPSSPDLGRYPKATTPCKTQAHSGHGPIPRPPGQEALRASPAGSPAAHAQPALPPPRSPAQLLSSEFCAARRGYSRSFPSTSRPSFPIRAWPEAVRQKQAAKGRKMGELGNGHLSSRFPQTLCPKSSVSERKNSSPSCTKDTASGERRDRRQDPPDQTKPPGLRLTIALRPSLGTPPRSSSLESRTPCSRLGAHGVDPQV